jgi:hypothetical protein
MPNRDHFGVEKQKWRTRLLRQLLLLANHAQNMIKIASKARHLSS